MRSSQVGVSDLTQSDVDSVCSSRRGATPTRFDRSRLLSRSGSAVVLSGKSSRASRSTSDLGQKIDTSLLSPTKSVARFEQFSARQRVLASPATMTRSTRPSQMPTVEIQDTVEIAQALRLATSEDSEALVYEPIHAVDHVASTTCAEGTSLLSTQHHVATDSPSSVLEAKAHVPEVPCSHSTREPELVCDHAFAVSSRLELLATPREGSGPAHTDAVESCCQNTPTEVTTPQNVVVLSKSTTSLCVRRQHCRQFGRWAWRGVAWRGVVWCGVVWCGRAWSGVFWRVVLSCVVYVHTRAAHVTDVSVRDTSHGPSDTRGKQREGSTYSGLCAMWKRSKPLSAFGMSESHCGL